MKTLLPLAAAMTLVSSSVLADLKFDTAISITQKSLGFGSQAVLSLTAFGTFTHGLPPSYTRSVTCGIRIDRLHTTPA